jgi:hypothetical protein
MSLRARAAFPWPSKARAAHEGPLLAAGEQVERRRPFGGGERLHALAVGLPVAGALVVHALDEVVAQQQERHDGAGAGTQARGKVVLVEDLDQRLPVADRLQDLRIQPPTDSLLRPGWATAAP